MTKDQNISTVERRRIILDQLHQNKQVNISQLNEQFRVSEVTLRKDLRYLENKKLLIRSRSGAGLSANKENYKCPKTGNYKELKPHL